MRTTRLLVAGALVLAAVPNAWAAPAAAARSGAPVAVPRTTTVPGLSLSGRVKADAPALVSVASAPATTSIVVGFSPVAEAQAVFAALTMGAAVLDRPTTGTFAVVRVPFGVDATTFVNEIRAEPGVEFAEPDAVFSASTTSNDPGFPSQWGMTKIGAPAAWDVSRGSGVKVAVVDTGVDVDHPDLVGRLDMADAWNSIGDTTTVQDDQGHGTHVSGIVAATLNNGVGVAGVANLAQVMPIKVLGSDGNGTGADVAEGIRWAADHGATVINLSLGGPTYSSVIDSAIQYAVGRDCIVVAATGNDDALGVNYPARLPNVVGVGSTTSLDSRSSFSNYGPETDISAPGSGIYSTINGGTYGTMSGTSMAAPHVAGVAALIRAHHPEYTRTQVENRLFSTAKDLGVAGKDDYYGWGRVDAAAAVGASSGPPPAPDGSEIPGLAALASPITGSLATTTDLNAVYQLDLTAGSTLSAVLTGDAGTDFDLYLYGPSATSIATATALAVSDKPIYPDTIHYVVPTTGRYYLRVFRFYGFGSYSLAWGVMAPGAPADADIPGVPATTSPITGSLSTTSNPDDVFSLTLAQGQVLSVRLNGATGTDLDLFLFAPRAVSVKTDPPVASAMRITYPETFTYVVPVSGVYYLDARAATGAGAYTLEFSVTSDGGDPDGNVSGAIPCWTSPVHGTVSTTIDRVDVYSVLLNAGQTINTTLSGPATGTNFDLYLYGPETNSIHEGGALASSTGPTSQESIAYTAVTGGLHYVAVQAYSGSGAYTLTVSVAADEYTIESSAGAGGSIAPLGVWTVAAGDGVTYTVTPDLGHHLADLQVDGTSAGAPAEYRFGNVSGNHVIAATFAVDTFTVTKDAASGGTISGPSSVAYGADATYTIAADAGHDVFRVFVDDVSLGATTTATLHDVKGPHTISATFSAVFLPIVCANGLHGHISPEGMTPVEYGADSPTYSITPDDGYAIAYVLVDGVSRGAVTSYRFTNVTVPHTISAVFRRATGITISSSRTIIHHGTKVTYSGTVTPNMPNGTHVVVEIRKSSSSTWTKLSTRNTYGSHHWSYTYHTHSRHPGTYYVRVRYPGSATHAGCVSSSKKMILR